MAPQEADKILQKFDAIISQHFGLSKKSKVIVGVSGGMDSMVLLFLLHHFQIPTVAVHVNYQLRGDESDAEEALVRDFCKKYKIPFFHRRVDSSVWENENLQATARKIRYDFYMEIMQQEKADWIATAHHAGDQVETMVLHWLRGDFPLVPSGMSEHFGRVIRPLLSFSKNEVTWLADGFVIPWRMDSTNLKNEYARNKLRNQILPLMRDIQPGLDGMIQQQHARNQMIHNYVFEHLEKECKAYLIMSEDQILIDQAVIKGDEYDELRLSFLASKLGWSFEKGEELLQLLKGGTGRKYEDSRGVIWRERKGLRIQYSSGNISKEEREILVEDVPVPNAFLPNNDIAILDKSKLNFPLKIRRWQQGDFFYPLGMKSKKKISDFLIHEKVEMADKEDVFVVLSGKDICWVAGYRVDNRFKITPETKAAVQISLK
ncbi:MAG: tRNA lysidine(34) synthetase TilS [Flavobacteriales bacterium]